MLVRFNRTGAFAVCLYTLAILVWGCETKSTHGESGVAQAETGFDVAPTNFIHQIDFADHVVVTNTFGWTRQYEGFSLTISGHKMKSLVRALSALKNHRLPDVSYPPSASICDWQLQFYQGSNCLTTANFQDYVIRCDGGEYNDNSGILDKVYSEIMAKVNPLQKNLEN